MTKKELVEAVYEFQAEYSDKPVKKGKVQELLDGFLTKMTETLDHGEEVRLSGFGTFKTVDKDERFANNPRTGEQIIVPAKRVVKFTAAKALKETLND